eukprot:scaffold4786_cov142-Skeletonema_dohrnii-CCMP3373.AAC.1
MYRTGAIVPSCAEIASIQNYKEIFRRIMAFDGLTMIPRTVYGVCSRHVIKKGRLMVCRYDTYIDVDRWEERRRSQTITHAVASVSISKYPVLMVEESTDRY